MKHGTRGSYVNGCRCVDCTAANSVYSQVTRSRGRTEAHRRGEAKYDKSPKGKARKVKWRRNARLKQVLPGARVLSIRRHFVEDPGRKKK